MIYLSISGILDGNYYMWTCVHPRGTWKILNKRKENGKGLFFLPCSSSSQVFVVWRIWRFGRCGYISYDDSVATLVLLSEGLGALGL